MLTSALHHGQPCSCQVRVLSLACWLKPFWPGLFRLPSFLSSLSGQVSSLEDSYRRDTWTAPLPSLSHVLDIQCHAEPNCPVIGSCAEVKCEQRRVASEGGRTTTRKLVVANPAGIGWVSWFISATVGKQQAENVLREKGVCFIF